MLSGIQEAALGRRRSKVLLLNELQFLGMEFPTMEKKNNVMVKEEANKERRKLLQVQYEEDYLQALVSTKEKYFID
jgi:IQ and AAA domain-containing protein